MTIKYITAKDTTDLYKIQDKAISSVHKARDLVQIALVATLIHAGKHGDYTGATRMIEGTGNAVNGAALVKFFVRFGGLLVAEDGSGFSGWQGADYIRANLNDAKATMWWTLKKVNPFAGYSAEAEIKKFIKRHKAMTAKLDSMSDEDKEKVSLTINDETIKALLSLVNFEAIITGEATNDEGNAKVAA